MNLGFQYTSLMMPCGTGPQSDVSRYQLITRSMLIGAPNRVPIRHWIVSSAPGVTEAQRKSQSQNKLFGLGREDLASLSCANPHSQL